MYFFLVCLMMGYEGEFLRGDANGDGRVNIVDAVLIINFLYDRTHDPAIHRCYDLGDADDDGGVKIFDAIYILHYLFLGGPPPPPPFPEMGRDPTPDGISC